MTSATARIAIAGSGCVLPTGWGVEGFWAAAREGRSAIAALQTKLFHSERITAFGQIDDATHQRSRQDVAQNLQRYCPPAVIWGVSAVRQALAETFDADKPCSLCCAVREAKRQENKQVPPEIRLREKLTLVFQPTTDFLASVSIETSWPEAGSLQAGRGRAEPTVPPPRSLGLLG